MDLHCQKIIETAQELGIQTTILNDFGTEDAVLLEYKGQKEIVVKGTFLSEVNLQSKLICDNKQLTKEMFSRLDIPHPKSIVFKNPEESKEQIDDFWNKEQNYVCKPLSGTEGEGVELYIEKKKLASYWEKRKKHFDYFLLEEFVNGVDVRIQAIGGKLIAACTREPAYVIGDGRKTLGELIELRQAEVERQNPNNKLEIDKKSLKLIKKQGFTMESVPNNYQKVKLNKLSNMSQGAVATDITDELHLEYHMWVDKISFELGQGTFALDIISENYTQNPNECSHALEINPCPDWLHHTFSETRTHDLANYLVRDLFFMF